MSTFLELVTDTCREAGVSGGGPTTVVGQTGEYWRIVAWVAGAWAEIQAKRNDWMWMLGEFSFATIADQYAYTSAEAGIASRFRRWDFGNLRIYTTASGVSDETPIGFKTWESWRQLYRLGVQTASRPTTATTLPNLSLGLGPKPTAGFTVSGDYWKSAQALAADADIPEMPVEFHRIIIYRALMMYGRFNAAPEIFSDAEQNYNAMMRGLILNQTPQVELGGPLA